MQNTTQSSDPDARPSPEANHRQQAAWQIWVPFGMLLAAFIAALVLTILFTGGYSPEAGLADQQSPLAKGSVIMLVSGVCISSLLPLLVLVGLVFMNGKIIKGLPNLAHKIQTGLDTATSYAKLGSDKLTAPIISLSARKAAVKALFNKIQFWKKETQS